MSSEKRQFARIKLPVTVELSLEGEAPVLLITRDISDGGAFLETKQGTPELGVGTRVYIKVNADLNGEPPPRIAARIVRTSPEGLAVAFEQEND